jgi:AbrB family looped-hinge helix DNA binding protein
VQIEDWNFNLHNTRSRTAGKLQTAPPLARFSGSARPASQPGPLSLLRVACHAIRLRGEFLPRLGKGSPVSTTKVSSKGQVVIPKHLCKALSIRPGTRLAVELDGNAIRMTPVSARWPRTAEDGYGMIKYRGPRVRIDDVDPAAALQRPGGVSNSRSTS